MLRLDEIIVIKKDLEKVSRQRFENHNVHCFLMKWQIDSYWCLYLFNFKRHWLLPRDGRKTPINVSQTIDLTRVRNPHFTSLYDLRWRRTPNRQARPHSEARYKNIGLARFCSPCGLAKSNINFQLIKQLSCQNAGCPQSTTHILGSSTNPTDRLLVQFLANKILECTVFLSKTIIFPSTKSRVDGAGVWAAVFRLIGQIPERFL